VFPVAGAIYYWFPKMTGRLLDERLGRWNFWLMFGGMNLAFFPMHISGLLGMPRRIYTFHSGFGWDTLNLVTTIGSFLFAAGVLLLLANVLWGLRHGRAAGADPWGAGTLEWSVPSPPPHYNFAVIPIVASRHPLWEDRLEGAQRSRVERGFALDAGRETIGTSVLDGRPDAILKMPDESYAPLLLALALAIFFSALLARAWWLAAAGLALAAAAILVWLWPERSTRQTAEIRS